MKYELTDETKEVEGKILHRIRALKDFHPSIGTVHKGDLGGFVESEFNLSQVGNCWIGDDSMVYDNARVYDDAQVWEESIIYEAARIFHGALICNSSCNGSAWIYGCAAVKDSYCDQNSLIYGFALVDGAIISEFSRIKGNSRIVHSTVHGYAQITDSAQIYNSVITGNSIIKDNGCVKNSIVNHNARISQQQSVIASGCVTNLTKDLSESIRAQTSLIPFNGRVIAYKQVRKNLTSFYDDKFQYKVGEWAIEPNAENSNESCAPGLHFANAGYWNKSQDITNSTFIIARINLEDIITVQEGKIRCRKAFILGTYDVKKLN